jgi:DNA primase
VEIGAVEPHPWNANIDDIEHPEMLVFDLERQDPVTRVVLLTRFRAVR